MPRKNSDLPIACVLGSNGGETAQQDVEILADIIGCPRTGARVAVVSYAAGLFHPKVYHLTRADGTQAAYVGSANLTGPGVTGLNIEAGIILDTLEGDPEPLLDDISGAIEDWFNSGRAGVEYVLSKADVGPLAAAGILGVAPVQPTLGKAPAAKVSGKSGASLKPLITFAAVPGVKKSPAAVMPGGATIAPSPAPTPPAPTPPAPTPPAPTPPAGLPAFPQHPFPPYVLIAPGATTPTQRAAALSGATLPSGATGIVTRLSRDSARHFVGGTGTANISLPVPTIGTLRDLSPRSSSRFG